MNRQRWTAFIMTFLYGLTIVVIIGWMTKEKTEQVMSERGLPSPASIQRQLNILEPENPLKIDGKLGKLTQEKWDRVYIRESAKAAFAEIDKKEMTQ